MTVIAVGQFSATQDRSANLRTIGHLAEQAADLGASALVLPEYSSFTPPTFDQRIAEHAEPLDGTFATVVRSLAADNSVALVVGMIERIPDATRVHNTLLLVDADGELCGTYRKLHLYDAHGVVESEWIAPGDPDVAPTMDLGGIRLGAQTCYDLRFPETTRVLVDAGADVVAVPAQWVPGPRKEDHWSTLLRSRAIENTIYVAGAGQCAPTGVGCSTIVDPMGVGVAALGDRSGVVAAPVERERIDAVRATNPVLSARRYRVVPRTG